MGRVINYLKGYRTCHECKKQGHKSEMSVVNIPDGIMDDRPVWYHNECKRLYFEKLSRGRGIFTAMACFAAGLETKIAE